MFRSKVTIALHGLLIISILFIMTYVLPKSLGQPTDSIDLYPVDSKPFGLSYEDHIMNYWKFILPIPTDQNPAEDPTGEQCIKGQNVSNSSIFYLHGNSGGTTEKTCRIPAGLGLFIPIIQAEASTGEQPGASLDELSENVKRDQDRVSALDLTINDKEFKHEDLKKYRVHNE